VEGEEGVAAQEGGEEEAAVCEGVVRACVVPDSSDQDVLARLNLLKLTFDVYEPPDLWDRRFGILLLRI
jgi:hypothetical protein